MEAIPRRQFIKTSGLLSIGFSLFGCMPENGKTVPASEELFTLEPSPDKLPDPSGVDAWLQVLADGTVQVLTGKMELGQGLTTVMQQVAGEELNIEPGKVKIVLADTGRTPNEGYTAGSRSVERSAMTVRRAAAAAREQLILLAAARWETDPAEVNFNDGLLEHSENKERFHFGDLLQGNQITAAIPDNVSLKPKEAYQWVGRPVPHPDLEKIVRGQAIYVQDLRLPEMVHARVVRPPIYGAQLKSWDSTVEQMPGVLQVVKNGSFLGVIASEEYQVLKALKALEQTSEWEPALALPEISSWKDFLQNTASQQNGSERKTPHTHQAVYTKPYIMHGSIGPSCAIAAFQEGRLHIWSHTQGVYPLRSTLSDLTGLSEEKIRVTGMRGSGCYGHNGADDVAAEAALLAMAYPGKPIRLQWQRIDEHKWEPYGSAMCMDISARLDSRGMITDWNYQLRSDSHSTRPRGNAANFVSARHLASPFEFKRPGRVGGGTRNSEPYYKFPGSKIEDHHVAGPLRSSALRGLGAYANIFAIESFMEELAEIAGQDPLDFRIRHLEDDRAIEVIQELRALLTDEKTNSGEGIGYGFSRYKNSASYCAVAAKVHVDLLTKKVRPVKMWAVLDAGEVINPDGLKNQTEGGMIQAASWTLLEEVQFDTELILSKDWQSYPILRFDQIPETEVLIIDRPDQPPLGAGEAAQGPAGAAVANAVYAASGQRIRELPIIRNL